MDKVDYRCKEEEAYVNAAYELATRITANDKELQELRYQVIKYPSDQITYRRYFARQAKLISQFTEQFFPEGSGGPRAS